MTESVISYFVRYSSRLLACFTCSAWARPSGVSAGSRMPCARARSSIVAGRRRSEEHTSELQSRLHLVCRLLLEKKKKKTPRATSYNDMRRDGQLILRT